tara:strand:- start:194 stop:616 length:423 start_codon:yes stop_codon:yes gene_type:complete
MQVKGKCYCGSVKIKANIDLNNIYSCHCIDCQIISGGPFRTMIGVPKEDINISGETKEYIKIADSGNKRIQSYCANCFTSLFSSSMTKERFSVRTAIFNERNKLIPKKHLYGRSSVKWLNKIFENDWVTTMPDTDPYNVD